MLIFTLLINASHGRSPPQFHAGGDNFLLPADNSTVDINIDKTELLLDFYSKTESDTIVENTQVTADTEFKILRMWCDGILLEPWFKNHAVYQPRYFAGYLEQCPDAPTIITAPYQFNFPGTIVWSWQGQFWDWYFDHKNKFEVINFLEQEPDRVWKFRGSLDPCADLVTKIKQVLDL